MKTGKIVDFRGSWSSGLGTLVLKVGKKFQEVPCENTMTVRALDDMFGDVIAPDHTIDVFAIRGREINFEVDGSGLLLSIGPVE